MNPIIIFWHIRQDLVTHWLIQSRNVGRFPCPRSSLELMHLWKTLGNFLIVNDVLNKVLFLLCCGVCKSFLPFPMTIEPLVSAREQSRVGSYNPKKRWIVRRARFHMRPQSPDLAALEEFLEVFHRKREPHFLSRWFLWEGGDFKERKMREGTRFAPIARTENFIKTY